MLGSRHQAQMPFFHLQSRIECQITKRFKPRSFFEYLPEPFVVAFAANVVKHHTDEIHGWIELLKPQRNGGSARGRALRIDDQNDGRTQQLRNMSGTAALLVWTESVEQAHDAFYDRNVRTSGRTTKYFPYYRFITHPGVQIAGGPLANPGVV